MQNKELLKFFYKTIEFENEKEGIMIDEQSFNAMKVRLKILDLEKKPDNFFDDFVIIEEEMISNSEKNYGFTCIVKIKELIYIYELDDIFETTIFSLSKGFENISDYNLIESHDINYEILTSKIDVVYNLISKYSKYKLNFLLKTDKQKLDFIKI